MIIIIVVRTPFFISYYIFTLRIPAEQKEKKMK